MSNPKIILPNINRKDQNDIIKDVIRKTLIDHENAYETSAILTNSITDENKTMLQDALAGVHNNKKFEKKRTKPDVWEKFFSLSSDQQKIALSHRFVIDYSETNGWQDIFITLDGISKNFCVSYIGKGIKGLALAIKALEDGYEFFFTWMDEPGYYTWHFDRHGGYVLMQPPHFPKSVFIKYSDLLFAIRNFDRAGF